MANHRMPPSTSSAAEILTMLKSEIQNRAAKKEKRRKNHPGSAYSTYSYSLFDILVRLRFVYLFAFCRICGAHTSIDRLTILEPTDRRWWRRRGKNGKCRSIDTSEYRSEFFRKQTLEPVYLQWLALVPRKTEVNAKSMLLRFIHHCAFPVRMVCRKILAR